jgi:hypothetical protein
MPLVLCAGAANMDALALDPVAGGFSIAVDAQAGETLRLAYVSDFDGADACGLGRAAYEAARGRTAMQLQYLVEWEVEGA